jgi:hypothetical protein
MTRHFGFPSETSETASGDQPQSRSLHSAYTTRADNVINLADHYPSRGDRLNSGRLTAAPLFIPEPIDHRELGAFVLSICFVCSPAIIVTAAVIIYALLIA